METIAHSPVPEHPAAAGRGPWRGVYGNGARACASTYLCARLAGAAWRGGAAPPRKVVWWRGGRCFFADSKVLGNRHSVCSLHPGWRQLWDKTRVQGKTPSLSYINLAEKQWLSLGTAAPRMSTGGVTAPLLPPNNSDHYLLCVSIPRYTT